MNGLIKTSVSGRRLIHAVGGIAALALLASACGGDSVDPEAEEAAGDTEDESSQDEASTDEEQVDQSEPVEVITWDYTAAALPDEGMVNATVWWADQIRERTNGQLDITMHFNGSLVPPFEQLDAVSEGLIESSLITDLYFPQQTPLTSVIGIPFETEDPYAATMAFYELYETNEAYRNEIEGLGLVAVNWVPWSSTVIASDEPLPDLESLAGKRFRAIGAFAAAMEAAGVDPVAMGPAEVYDGINRGLVSGWAGIPFDSVKDFSIQEVAKNIVDIRYGHYGTSFVGIRVDEWDALSEDVQQTVLEVSEEVQQEIAIEELMAWEETACGTYDEAGAELTVWTDEQREEFIDLIGTSGVDNWVASTVENSELTEETVLQFHEEYLAAYERHLPDSPYIPLGDRC